MFKKIWNGLVWTVIFFEILLVIIFYGSTLFNVKTFVVTSGSMVPKYPVGSLIYVKEVKTADVKVGNSITFHMKNSPIIATHEVYKIDYENKEFYTQGINNKTASGEIIHDSDQVPFINLIGKPVFCIPYLGYINMVITNKPGSYILIVSTLTIMVISCLFNKERREKNEKK